MNRVVIGTAGHIDHGKTSLVRAMTGIDTDRLKEEKKRGISIELGFAPLKLPNGQLAAIVDVPGHERFIRQMLAGASGMDLVLLIIAADEGVMPQTREHLDILQLLGVNRGIIVITKQDLVDEEWLMLVEEDIREYVKDSTARDWPLVAVSSATGTNIDVLMNMIVDQVAGISEKSAVGQVRMPIDRVFTMTGFGTVVTGTLWSGKIRLGDILQLQPEDRQVRVRTLQVHNAKVEEALAGQRVAVNLQGIEVAEIRRGNVLVSPKYLTPSYRVNAALQLLPSAQRPLKNWARIRFHLGTDEAMGRVVLLEHEELNPGDRGYVQLVLEKPIVSAKNDRYVLRYYSPVTTIGGGVILDPNPPKQKRFNEAVLHQIAVQEEGTPEELLLQTLEKDAGKLFTPEEAAAVIETGPEETKSLVEDLIGAGAVTRVVVENRECFMSTIGFDAKSDGLIKALKDLYARYPLRKGLPREEVRSRLFKDYPPKHFNALIARLVETGGFAAEGAFITIPGRELMIDAATGAALTRVRELFRADPMSPPVDKDLSEAMAGIKPDLLDEILGYLEENGELVKIIEGMYFARTALEEARARMDDHFARESELSLAQARDLWGNSRKYALPMLEYFDRMKYTRRVGDNRVKMAK
ncbi:MAG: selenocysteine-specific translation elongation factor [Solirubrobacterales bacterium]